MRSLIKNQSVEAYKQGEDGWTNKKRLIMLVMANLGVRERLAEEYYTIIKGWTNFEERGEIDNIEFRISREEFEHFAKAEKPQEV